jgi:hypothetical protein
MDSTGIPLPLRKTISTAFWNSHLGLHIVVYQTSSVFQISTHIHSAKAINITFIKNCSARATFSHVHIWTANNYQFTFEFKIDTSIKQNVCTSLTLSHDVIRIMCISYTLRSHKVNWVTQVSSVWLQAGWPGDRGSIPSRGKRMLPLTSVSRPALRPTQPPVQWVLSPGLKHSRGVMLTTHPQLVPRSRMSRSYTSSPPKCLCGV